MQYLLEVRDLSVVLVSGVQTHPIVSDVSFQLDRGECLVILGESGGGKTVLMRSLTNLFPAGHSFRCEGEVLFDGHSFSGMTASELTSIRRNSVRYVFQDPSKALNPVATIRSQMALADENGGDNESRLESLLAEMNIPEPAAVLRSFPHQLSIGMAQRVVLAMALLPSPQLLIADEPTSAVDVDTRELILGTLARRKQEQAMSVIMATHDIDVARSIGDRIVVVLGGLIVENGPAKSVLSTPLHPDVQEFLEAPRRGVETDSEDESSQNNGISWPPSKVEEGCVYAGRCPRVRDRCRTDPPQLESADSDREVRCFYWK